MDDYTRLVMSEKDSRIEEQTEEIADLRHEVEQLRRQLAEAEEENLRIQVDNAKLRFYVVELEAASRTIDMQLAQQAAREKYEAAFGDHAADGRPIGVDIPGQPYCQLPEGHDGPHEYVCLGCNGTGEIDNSPFEYMRCPLCLGSGRAQGTT